MRPYRALSVAFAAALLVAACSSSTAAPAASSAASAAASPAAAASSDSKSGYGSGDNAGGSPAASAGISLATTKLGSVLAGPTGMTLYLFMPDTASTSACTDKCATAWPPLTGDLPALGTGLDKANFASIARADGTKQVTYFGHPLYYFSGDKAAGDTNGQGLNQKWYVLGADGKAIGQAAAASPSAAASAAAAGISLADTKLGKVLTGPTGMTVYMFVPDTTTSSACTGGCATAWPPLTGDLPTLGTGLDKGDFASITRDDGSKQVTFYGHPLYYFGGDKAAGDTNGQGLNQKWYVLGSDGNPIK